MFRPACCLLASLLALGCSTQSPEAPEAPARRGQALEEWPKAGAPFAVDPTVAPVGLSTAEARGWTAMAADSSGNLLVAWLEQRGQRWAVFAARADAVLTAGPPLLLGEARSEPDGRPAVAFVGGGFLVAWRGPGGQLLAALLSPGGEVVRRGQLYGASGGAPVLVPQADRTMVIWPENGTIRYALLEGESPLLDPVNPGTLVAAEAVPVEIAQVAAAYSADLFLAWVVPPAEQGGTGKVLARHFDSSLTWDGTSQLAVDANPGGPISVATKMLGSTSASVVVWSEDVDSTDGWDAQTVRAVALASDGTVPSDAVSVPPQAGDPVDQRWPVALPSTRGFAIHWIEVDPSRWAVDELSISAGVAPAWGARSGFALEPAQVPFSPVAVVPRVSGDVAALVIGSAPRPQVELWRLGSSGVAGSNSLSSGNASQQRPAAAFDPASNRHLVVWQQANETDRDILGNWIFGNQPQSADPVEIAAVQGCDEWGPKLAIGGGKALVAWRAHCGEAHFVRALVLGEPSRAFEVVASAATTLEVDFLDDRFLLAWDAEPSGPLGESCLRGAWLPSSGIDTGELFSFPGATRSEPRASLACNETSCIVAWNPRAYAGESYHDQVAAAAVAAGSTEPEIFALPLPTVPDSRLFDALPSVTMDEQGFLVFWRNQIDWNGVELKVWRLPDPLAGSWPDSPPTMTVAGAALPSVDFLLTSPRAAFAGSAHALAFVAPPTDTAWSRAAAPAPFLDELRVVALLPGAAAAQPTDGLTVGGISSDELPVLSPEPNGSALLVASAYDLEAQADRVFARRVQLVGQQPPDAGVSDGGLDGADAGEGADGGTSLGAQPDLFGCSSAGGGRAGAIALAIAALAALVLRRRGGALSLVLLALALPQQAQAARPKRARVAVLSLEVGPGVDANIADLLTDQLATSVQQHLGEPVLSSRDIRTAIGFEKERQLLGCTEESCLAELGGALGVDYLITGSLGRLGEVLLLNVRSLDMRRMIALERFSERVPFGKPEAYLDAVDRAAVRLLPGNPSATAAEPMPKGGAQDATAAAEAPFEWGLGLRFQARPADHLSGAWTLSAALRPSPAYELSAGAMLTGALNRSAAAGALLRAAVVPFAQRSSLRPVVALEVPLLFAPDFAAGAGGSVGLEWRPASWLALGLHVPVHYFFAAPEGYDRFYFFVAPSLCLML